jgi:hypothetical protein
MSIWYGAAWYGAAPCRPGEGEADEAARCPCPGRWSHVFRPLATGAQSRARRGSVSFRSGPAPDPAKPNPVWVAFLKGLDELGWVEGRKIIIERRFAGGVARFADVGRLDA